MLSQGLGSTARDAGYTLPRFTAVTQSTEYSRHSRIGTTINRTRCPQRTFRYDIIPYGSNTNLNTGVFSDGPDSLQQSFRVVSPYVQRWRSSVCNLYIMSRARGSHVPPVTMIQSHFPEPWSRGQKSDGIRDLPPLFTNPPGKNGNPGNVLTNDIRCFQTRANHQGALLPPAVAFLFSSSGLPLQPRQQ